MYTGHVLVQLSHKLIRTALSEVEKLLFNSNSLEPNLCMLELLATSNKSADKSI